MCSALPVRASRSSSEVQSSLCRTSKLFEQGAQLNLLPLGECVRDCLDILNVPCKQVCNESPALVGQVNDPVINSKVNMLGSLYKVPTSSLSSVASQWQELDEYGAKKAYTAVFGYASFPKFSSDRLDYGASILHTVFGWDWLTFKLK